MSIPVGGGVLSGCVQDGMRMIRSNRKPEGGTRQAISVLISGVSPPNLLGLRKVDVGRGDGESIFGPRRAWES